MESFQTAKPEDLLKNLKQVARMNRPSTKLSPYQSPTATIKGKSRNEKEATEYRALAPTECQLGLPDKTRRSINFRVS